MMRVRYFRILLIIFVTLAPIASQSAEKPNIANYKCSEFLDDVMHPRDGTRLLRSMMIVAWSTGYAAAYGKDNLRADPRAFRLIAATIADVCTKNPDQLVVQAIAQEVRSVFPNAK